jgi:formamidopyrimidine-DNA glycosylase
MPELPDVQVYKEYLDATALHQRIEAAVVEGGEELLRGVSARALRERLRGGSLRETRRHGKHLFAGLAGDGWLRLHFGMTGELRYYKRDDSAPDHVRLRLDFENGFHLAYRNVRKLGEIGWVEDPDAFVAAAGLGPDALDPGLDAAAFREALSGRRGTLKGALMNQGVVAGIGNVYSDEMLLRAGIHPAAKVSDLQADDLTRLHGAMGTVLREAVDARVDAERFPRAFILPRREEGAPCPRSGGPLAKARVAGRVTFYCPQDQPEGG